MRLINSEEGNKTPICENVFLVLISITQIDPKLHYVNFITSRDCLMSVRKRGVFIINRDELQRPFCRSIVAGYTLLLLTN